MASAALASLDAPLCCVNADGPSSRCDAASLAVYLVDFTREWRRVASRGLWPESLNIIFFRRFFDA